MSAGRYQKNKRSVAGIPPCRQCMHPAKINAGEADYKFWLDYAGIDTNGMQPSEWVRANGLPRELREIVEELMRASFLRDQRDLVSDSLRLVS